MGFNRTRVIHSNPTDAGNLVSVSFTGSGDIAATVGSNSAGSDGAFATNTEYFVVGKITSSNAGNDLISVNVFKDGDGIPLTESYLVSSTGASLSGTLTGIAFTQFEVFDNDRDRAYLDEFRLGTSWESVAVPEPSALALLLGAGALLLAHRRRRG